MRYGGGGALAACGGRRPNMADRRPPFPPFTRETAIRKIRGAEEAWNSCEDGLNMRRLASINDLPIKESERKFHCDRAAPRPADHPGLSDLDL